MKTCTFCGETKSLDQFTMRKRPPIKPYQACKACETVAYNMKPNANYKQEVHDMREKAKQLRKFTPEQDALIYKRVRQGETRKEIAKELGVNPGTVGNAYKRAVFSNVEA